MKGHDKRLDSYIQQVRPRFERMLAEMVEQPSISMDPTHAPDIRRAALLAVQFLKDLGAEARVVETGGYPVVSGGWTTGSRHPTVTVYNHLDVQPAQEPEWRQPPFAFRKRNGVYYGRGATDDKGPALTALLAGRYAVEHGVPINVRFLWELEEEIGSPHFAEALRKAARRSPMGCAGCWGPGSCFGPEPATRIRASPAGPREIRWPSCARWYTPAWTRAPVT